MIANEQIAEDIQKTNEKLDKKVNAEDMLEELEIFKSQMHHSGKVQKSDEAPNTASGVSPIIRSSGAGLSKGRSGMTVTERNQLKQLV